jgi:hypothetical protein
MTFDGNEAWKEQASEARTAHERGEEDSKGNWRRPDDQFQKLKPDDFVNQRRCAAEKREKKNQFSEPRSLPGSLFFFASADKNSGETVVALVAGGIKDHVFVVARLSHFDQDSP